MVQLLTRTDQVFSPNHELKNKTWVKLFFLLHPAFRDFQIIFIPAKYISFIHLLFNNQVLELGTKLSQDKNNCNLAGMYLCLQCVLGRSEQWMEDGLI